MSRRIPPLLVWTLIFTLILSACGTASQKTPAANSPANTAAPASPATATAPAAQPTGTAPVPAEPTAAPTETLAPTATSAPAATATQAATSSPAATSAPAQASSAACNAAEFVSDVTVPPQTKIASDLSFIKTWAVKNTGSCAWTTGYQLVLTGGYNMFGQKETPLTQEIAPGATANLSIKLVVPSNSGMYRAEYKLADANGNIFGVGPNGSDPLVVQILTAITPTPGMGYAVTNVSISVEGENSASATCPPGATFKFSAKISTNARGTVTYHWVFSDGFTTGTEPLIFNSAGSHTVTTTWTFGSKGAPAGANPHRGYASIYIDIPNDAAFGQASVKLTCQ